MDEILYLSGIGVMAKKGYLLTKVSDITSEANVAIGSYYNHYKNKSDFLYKAFYNEIYLCNRFLIDSGFLTHPDGWSMFNDWLINRCVTNKKLYSIISCEKGNVAKVVNIEDLQSLKMLWLEFNTNLRECLNNKKTCNYYRIASANTILKVSQELILSIATEAMADSHEEYAFEVKQILSQISSI